MPSTLVRARRLDQVRDELGADGNARLVFAVLPRITVSTA